jgi:F0F1-type ATP synthase membrane subunit c/vacuolar-type H+-ATPase subunit K
MSTRETAQSESGRRITAVAHVAMLASIGLYAGLLWLARPAVLEGPGRAHLSSILLAVGLAEFAGATWFGRRLLSSSAGRAGVAERVRRYFLIRFAAAEAIAIFGLVAGFKGSPAADSAILFAVSAACLIAAAPSRRAWAHAWGLTTTA